jgi:hypothetical protein
VGETLITGVTIAVGVAGHAKQTLVGGAGVNVTGDDVVVANTVVVGVTGRQCLLRQGQGFASTLLNNSSVPSMASSRADVIIFRI